MTEADWLTCTSPASLLDFLGEKTSDRKRRLFGCACCRRVWPLLLDERSRKAVELAERLADGQSSDEERLAAFEEAEDATNAVRGQGQRVYCAAVAAGEVVEDEVCDRYCGWYSTSIAAANSKEEECHQAGLVHDIFGNPFRPASVNPSWLTWNDGTVVKIAQGIYDDRAFDRLPILADALEEAGCHDADILGHCRQPGNHIRGCWVVDLALKKA